MLRRIFGFCSAISLLLLVATAALWIRTYWVADSLGWAKEKSVLIAGSSRGRFGSVHIQFGPKHGSWTFQGHRRQTPYPLPTNLPTSGTRGWPRLGILYDELTPSASTRASSLILPAWLIAIIMVVLPASWMVSYRRRLRLKRQQSGELCASCGYDLRATTERCPECGTPINAMRKEG